MQITGSNAALRLELGILASAFHFRRELSSPGGHGWAWPLSSRAWPLRRRTWTLRKGSLVTFFVNLVPYPLGSLGTFLIPYSPYTIVCFSIALNFFIFFLHLPLFGSSKFQVIIYLFFQACLKLVILLLSWIEGEHNHVISNRLIPVNVGRKIHFCSFFLLFSSILASNHNTLNSLLAQP